VFQTKQWAAGISPRTGWEWHIGDFNGDGKDDFAGYHPNDGSWWVGTSNGNVFQTKQWAAGISPRTGWEWHIGDFNGDDRDDVGGYFRGDNTLWLLKSSGVAFATENWGPGVIPRHSHWWIADASGDGRDDIITYSSSSPEFALHLSDGSRISADNTNAARVAAAATGRTVSFVFVSVVGTTLTIKGDAGDNHITINEVGVNLFEVIGTQTATHKTYINGLPQRSPRFFATSVDVAMGNGADSVGFASFHKGTTLDTLRVNMGRCPEPYSDHLNIGIIRVAGGTTISARNALTMNGPARDAVFGGSTHITGGNRRDRISLQGQFANLDIRTAGGDDQVRVGGIGAPDLITAHTLRLLTGNGNDNVELFGGTVRERLFAALGRGNDQVDLLTWTTQGPSVVDGQVGDNRYLSITDVSGGLQLLNFRRK
jgi:hypothetical protein